MSAMPPVSDVFTQAQAEAHAKALAGLSNRKPAATPPGRVPENKVLLIDAAEWLSVHDRQVWLIKDIIQKNMIYAVTAATNHGKTAITTYAAACIVGRRKFAGREVTPGDVLILCGEDPSGFRARLRATMDKLGMDIEDVAGRLVILPYALPLGMYIDQIKDEAAKRGGEFSLVLVDTSVAFFTGDSEDDNLQARSHAWDLRELTELPGKPAVLVNCHPTKGADRDNLLPRGGGAFLNEIDTNLTVWADGEMATLHWQRKKRGPDFDPIPFEFMGVSIDEGDYKTQTVVAWPISDERAAEMRRARNMDEDRLMWAMQHHPTHHFAQWASDCGWNGEASKSKVNRVMKRLVDFKYAEKFRGHYRLTKIGEAEAQKIR